MVAESIAWNRAQVVRAGAAGGATAPNVRTAAWPTRCCIATCRASPVPREGSSEDAPVRVARKLVLGEGSLKDCYSQRE